MDLLIEIHLYVAFLVALCAIVFSWNAMGLRVMMAVAGLQVLLGVILAGMVGSHIPLPPIALVHILCAIMVLVIYILARRLGDRPGGRTMGIVLGALGMILVFVTIALGSQIRLV